MLICGKVEEEKSLAAGEQSDPSEDDSEDEAFDDFTNNRDNVNLARAKPDAKKERSSSREGKKDRGEKYEESTSKE